MGSCRTGLLAYGGVVCLLAAVIIVISDMKPLSETFYSSLYNINNYIIIRDCFLLGPDTFKPVNIITLLRVQDFWTIKAFEVESPTSTHYLASSSL